MSKIATALTMLGTVYNRLGFWKSLVGGLVIVSACQVAYHKATTERIPYVQSVQVAVEKPVCGDDVSVTDYRPDCTYVPKNKRESTHVDAKECPVLLASIFDIPQESIKYVKTEYDNGKALHLFNRQDGTTKIEYVCTNNYGDVMAMWGVTYKGEKTSYSKWHNLNTETF